MAQKEVNYKNLEQIFSSDVTLSFNLLRFVNTANVKVPIESFSQALAYLGESNIRRFVALVAIASVSEGKPNSLYSLSLQRAHFCELTYGHEQSNSSLAFLVGLFSLLGALFDEDLEYIASHLPINDELKLALSERQGKLGKILTLALAYEDGDWKAINSISNDLSLNENISASYYQQAMRWANID
ncbi:HDOD domain-containing protein [Vibrio sp. kj40-1]|uniref:HDOD domain-containing protein n=1 Tax=Vibrio algarum TaxID=3020714 RepID=A0ABT4YMB4_9VIBR|nr:HDOD domain-containing protein [Vibrio sp. KJ40-1]